MALLIGHFRIFIHVLLIVLMTACVAAPGSGNREIVDTIDADAGDSGGTPPAIGTINFFQNGTVQTTGQLVLPADFNDSFYLRGDDINEYLNVSVNDTISHCLVTHFSSGIDNQLLVLAAVPGEFYNYSTLTFEKYYNQQSTDAGINSAICNTANVNATLNTDYPGATIAYSVATLSPSSVSSISSSDTRFLTTAGTNNNSVDVDHLSLKLSGSSGSGGGGTCTTSQCQALGFDCCYNGSICVNDGTEQPGANLLSEYPQAIADVMENAANYVNWPTVFYICSAPPPPTPTPTELPDAEATAAGLLVELTELYECTTLLADDEKSICTAKFDDASLSFPGPFSTLADDRNFSTTYTGTTGLIGHSIFEIYYAGEVLFSDGVDYSPGSFTINAGNDNLVDAQTVDVMATAVPSAPDDTVKLKYLIDGSCEYISSLLARCEKYYVQGQNIGDIDDHAPSSNQFLLPLYADTTKVINVTIDDIPYFEGTQWNLVAGAPSYIQFSGASNVALDNQVVKLKFFVDLTANPLMSSKLAALSAIDTYCGCGGSNKCSLEPQLNGSQVVGYDCRYPTPGGGDNPLNETVFVSTKTAPVRYFDQSGVYHDTIDSSTALQEGNAFKYTGGNLLRPNNDGTYIGFNEIYGSITIGAGTPVNPIELTVVKNRSYDLYTDSGQFSTCLTCGVDYYSPINKLYPPNFLFRGGGSTPDPSRSSRFNSSSFLGGQYRADDLLFGRACHIPATMIPWTHLPDSDLQTQRLNRMAAQHILFANGYSRDWYGFDYGSVIGSWDGVSWFSVGNERRVKAKTSKLFLAVNAYFSDLTQTNTYQVTVNEVVGGATSGDIDTDFESDGAECQQYHVCSTDQDCVTQLGWEYSCENVISLKTQWPTFNANAQEIANGSQESTIVSLLEGFSGGGKRCVYRGRGAPCHQDYTSVDDTTSYSHTSENGLHACNPNYYCQGFTNGVGAPQAKFNTAIARYGQSPQIQNGDATLTATDEFGLATRFIGRPFAYEGTDTVDVTTRNTFLSNRIDSICLPGRDPTLTTFLEQNRTEPNSIFKGDKVLGIGSSVDGNAANAAYFSSCSILDSSGNFLHQTSPTTNLSDASVQALAASQTLSTNHLSLFESTGLTFLNDFLSGSVTSPIHQTNRCLRAPGSVCFTDLDCGPSEFVKNTMLSFTDDGTMSDELNFWKEYMVCGQAMKKSDVNYDPKNNRCCRETGQTLTIAANEDSTAGTALDATDTLFTMGAAGIDYDLDQTNRYSRTNMVYDQTSTGALPPLRFFQSDNCAIPTSGGCIFEGGDDNTDQWKTFEAIASNSTCTGHWVREFSVENGGGHHWLPSKMQSIDMTAFRCLNWLARNSVADPPFTCLSPTDPNCKVRNISDSEASRFFDFMATLELVGVPQILVQTNDDGFAAGTEIHCSVDDQQDDVGAGRDPLDGTIVDVATEAAEYSETAASNTGYFSTVDDDNFDTGIKRVFSESQVAACIPTGESVDSTVSDSMCCTGKVFNNRCCLEDYTNISVYTNRFVSSEAKDLNDILFDTKTGYLNAATVESLAAAKSMCCSGFSARGIALSNLAYPGFPDEPDRTRRFVAANRDEDNVNGEADIWEFGARWNNHVYCVPDPGN